MTARRANFDQIDRKILNNLQQDSRVTFAKLAEKVATSTPSCLRRVKRLREEGVIEKEVAILNPAKVGEHLIAISEVSLRGHNLQGRDKAINFIRDIPEVIICYNVTGERDILFISILTSMADFEAKITEPLAEIPEINSINSYFAIKQIKFSPMWCFDEGR